ncbi:MAG: peptide chain release factor N(5)-glutamine methyltransferase [Candidatus Saccharibacteria bacterium]
MTIKQALEESTLQLKNNHTPSPRLDAELLLAHLLRQNREYLIAHDDENLTESQLKQYSNFIHRRLDHEPVAYITNRLDFYGIDFYVDNRVLSPRVETELVAEEAIKNAPKNSKLIDIGTGSGAIAIAIAKNRPDLEITASEVSADALDVAKLNAASILGDDHNIKFVVSDIFDDIEGKFETVVTNLPYVSEDYLPQMKAEVKKEPAIALFGGKGDGLDLYRKFYQQLPKHIIAGTRVYHESDPWQHEKLFELASSAGLESIFERYLILGFQKN